MPVIPETPIVEGAPIIRRQLASENVRNDVGLAHGETAHRVGEDILHRPEAIAGGIEARQKIMIAVHHEFGVAHQIDDIRRRRCCQ